MRQAGGKGGSRTHPARGAQSPPKYDGGKMTQCCDCTHAKMKMKISPNGRFLSPKQGDRVGCAMGWWQSERPARERKFSYMSVNNNSKILQTYAKNCWDYDGEENNE